MAARIFHERAWRIEAHRLRIENRRREFGRVVVLQVSRRIHEQRETRRVALGKSVVGESIDLVEDALRVGGSDAVGRHSVEHLLADGRHALATALVSHRLAQHVGFARCESRRGDCHLHPLLLKERHTERALQNGLERRMEILHRFLSVLSTQIRVHHLTLDRARPDERDLHDKIIEAPRLQSWQRIHLRSALHLKDADRVRRAEIVVHGLVGHVEQREIDGHAARLPDVEHAVLHQRQDAESEQIDLHETDGIEVVLLPLNHRAARHARRLDRDYLVEWLVCKHEATYMNGAMTWNLVQPFHDFGECPHAAVVRIESRALDDARASRLTQRISR